MHEKGQRRIIVDFATKINEYKTVFMPYKWWTWRSVVDRYNWCFEGYGYRGAIPSLWNNAVVWMTPWFRSFRHLLDAFITKNGMKLLWEDRNFAYLRTREGEQYYYMLRKRWLFWAELKEIQWIRVSDGAPVNTFVVGVMAMVNDNRVEEIEEEYKESSRVVCRGFILTKGGCQRMMDKMVESTKDKIDWKFTGV